MYIKLNVLSYLCNNMQKHHNIILIDTRKTHFHAKGGQVVIRILSGKENTTTSEEENKMLPLKYLI